MAATQTTDDLVRQDQATSTALDIPEDLSCCCTNPDCHFLRHAHETVQGLEKDIHRAATVGQALLARHESYVAHAQQERSQLQSTITKIESQHHSLEAENARLISENKSLLEQVDLANTSITDADAQIDSLTTTLNSTHHELQKLKFLASRTESLEAQLLDFEIEQAQLQENLSVKFTDERTARIKHQRAERTIANLESELAAIEQESREERRSHAQTIERLQRKTALEGVLIPNHRPSPSAATAIEEHQILEAFIKDVLDDNATLQSSKIEVEQLLNRSREETDELRQQLSDSQLRPWELHGQPHSLEDELARQPQTPSESVSPLSPPPQPQPQQQELHYHQHFHTPASRPKKMVLHPRRPRNRRLGSIGVSGSNTPTIPELTPLSPPESIYECEAYQLPSNLPDQYECNEEDSTSPVSTATSSHPASTIFSHASGNSTSTLQSLATSPDANFVALTEPLPSGAAKPAPLSTVRFRPSLLSLPPSQRSSEAIISTTTAAGKRASSRLPKEAPMPSALLEQLGGKKDVDKRAGYNPLADTFGPKVGDWIKGRWSGKEEKGREERGRGMKGKAVVGEVDWSGLREGLGDLGEEVEEM